MYYFLLPVEPPGETLSSSFNKNISFSEELHVYLENTHRSARRGVLQQDISVVIKREMALYETTNTRPENLAKVYQALNTIRPTSLESERAFSAVGRFVTPLRTRLGDDSLDGLVFMRQHYQR